MSRKYWYSYTGPAGSENLSNFTLLPSFPTNCPDGANLCALYALYGGDNHPLSLSSNIFDYIANAKVDFVKQPRIGPPIVLMKPS